MLLYVGVPLWQCALGIMTVVFRARRLHQRHGNVSVRVLRPGRTRSTRGQAVQVSDVFAWRGSPAAWNEDQAQVVHMHERPPSQGEAEKLRRIGDDPVVVELSGADGEVLTVAAAGADRGPLSALSRPADP